ncbi:protein DpdF [Candidatus Venteria ishoeyi]|uniref:DNA 3'-5' helicase n=1 Tax=Candidatus Venteria ishoeyi TaxID=1899563 RepID=A0A1H6FBA7_9GAMM|nr:protein DpdF [Candidatus Venteria ishoeyi]SEH06416.1 ATP-dependent DNA helicase RecQ [Candidatus Venteria ishoeyi]
MSVLHDWEAFGTLREYLQGSQGSAFQCTDYSPLERLRLAWMDDKQRSALDLAVLLRQALRYEQERRITEGGNFVDPKLNAPKSRYPSPEVLQRVGLTVRGIDQAWELRAVPWIPEWLSVSASQATDKTAVAAEICRPHASVPGDPMLTHLGYDTYRSVGQQRAIRSALCMPPGASLLVSLPTGEGKSLVFRLIDKIGFTDSKLSGTTLVVVPTVTLALNHEKSTQLSEQNSEPYAYVGGAKDKNTLILERIRKGEQGLCFVSPEAACAAAMRSALKIACEQGRLKALVVDEAHLVDAWGTGFRTEFQLLSGVREGLLKQCPQDMAFRTVLLSATLTQGAIDVLKTLFPGEPFGFVSASRLRPEPEFWVARRTNLEERKQRVLQALYHLPRPAILYVTKREDADNWYQFLRVQGFRSIRKVHGDTNTQERESVIHAWSQGSLDLVVATSAFGLGIDYRHVRTIIHACIPETLDRFYQEVGRAGRDGRACISLLTPAYGDDDIAKSLNKPKVITIERGFERWLAMFNHPDRKHLGRDDHLVRLDVAPGHNEQDIDMHGECSTDWNARILSVMARAGLIRLHGIPDQAPETGEYQYIEILEPTHLDKTTWEETIEPLRQAIAQSSYHNFDLMRGFIDQKDCPAELLAGLYEVKLDNTPHPVAKTCSGCHLCRQEKARHNHEYLASSTYPWLSSQGVHDSLARWLDRGCLLVLYTQEKIRLRHLRDCLMRLMNYGVYNIIFLGEPILSGVELKKLPVHKVFFVSWADTLVNTGLPKGPSVIFVGSGQTLTPANLQARDAGHERIFFVSHDQEDTTRPGVLLQETYRGRSLSFEQFHQRIVV